jgi:serpin B
MNRAILLTGTLVVAAAFVLPRCLLADATPAPNSATEISQMDNAFAIDLYHKLAERDGNLFFSPSSIELALAMTWAGARGATAEEMTKTLHFLPHEDPLPQLGNWSATLKAGADRNGFQLTSANALWAAKRYPFQPDFLARVEHDLSAHLSGLDFAADPSTARQTINNWVAEETHDRIKDLIGPGAIDKATRLVLTNAIYFKAAWDHQFNKAATQTADFNLTGGQKVPVPLMHRQGSYAYAEDESVQVLDLSYGHNQLAMRIFLPRDVDGLHKFETEFSSDRMKKLTTDMSYQPVQLWLPRFKVESKFELSQALSALGMKLAFDPEKADFSGMSTAEGLSISQVIHQAFVNTDEEGTEAAAATAVVMPTAVAVARPKPFKVFRADHPFVFAIVHVPTHAVIFMGRVVDPK